MSSLAKRNINGNVKDQSPVTDTNASDDETADETNNQLNNDETDNSDDEKSKKEVQNVPEAEELLKNTKKRAKTYKPFTEEMLTGPDGLKRIYNDFPTVSIFKGRGSEATDIKKLITIYKEWAFQLHPGISFQDVLIKCENMGSKGKIRANLQHLRDLERNRYLIDVLDMKPITEETTSSTMEVPDNNNTNINSNKNSNNDDKNYNNNNENDNEDSDDELIINDSEETAEIEFDDSNEVLQNVLETVESNIMDDMTKDKDPAEEDNKSDFINITLTNSAEITSSSGDKKRKKK